MVTQDTITGSVVAVTGASGGIGAAIAVELGARGAHLVLGARRADRLEAVAERVRAAGGTAVTVPMDVRDRAAHTALVDRARAQFGRLDVLVANAGVGRVRPLDELPVEEWDEMIDVNLRGVLYGLAAALPVFRAQQAGHLVVIASTSGLQISPGQVVYAATKNAVRTLCEGLRQEAGAELRVTEVSPGFVATDFVEGIGDERLRADYRARRDEIALAPAAIARAVAFALKQPAGVDVNQVVVRPTAQA